MTFKITNPYESVSALIGNAENHFKTNLHTHSTVSDGDLDYADMIKTYYENGFDVLCVTDHGIIGKKWNEKPAELPLYRYQYLLKRKKTPLTDEEFSKIENGTYECSQKGNRTYGRGMHCLTQGIELNMVTISKAHVNGFFMDKGQNNWGFENGFRYAVKLVDKAGGISFINHPGDWSECYRYIENTRNIKYIRLFGDIFLDYPSCVGTEVFNRIVNDTKNDRILWDNILKYVIPHGKRNVFGFSNGDSHSASDCDTSFMDFILPEYSRENMKSAMQNGTFFAISRYGKNECGENFVAEGMPPVVTGISVDKKSGKITLTAENGDKIVWIADGKEIETAVSTDSESPLTCTLDLEAHKSEISCYVRCQVTGRGGVTLTQPFICDDGNMARLITPDTRTKLQKLTERTVYALKSIRIVTLIDRIRKDKKWKASQM